MKQKKKIISLDIDSALTLMQEIYNDISEQKTFASLIMKKMFSYMKDSEDMSVLGPVIKEQQKILSDCTEKKISLVKLQGVLLKQTNGNKNGGFGNITLTDRDFELVEKYISSAENTDTNPQEYDVK
jgi:hypothetical protein